MAPLTIEATPTLEESELPEVVASAKTREDQAVLIVRKHVKWAAGAGFIPVPLVDLAAIVAALMAELNELAELYEVPVTTSKEREKQVIAALVAGVGIPLLAEGVIASLIKSIPGIGTVGGLLAMPVLAGALAYSVGKVFIQHFESGGTFLTFDPKKVESYYREKFSEGRDIAQAVRDDIASKKVSQPAKKHREPKSP